MTRSGRFRSIANCSSYVSRRIQSVDMSEMRSGGCPKGGASLRISFFFAIFARRRGIGCPAPKDDGSDNARKTGGRSDDWALLPGKARRRGDALPVVRAAVCIRLPTSGYVPFRRGKAALRTLSDPLLCPGLPGADPRGDALCRAADALRASDRGAAASVAAAAQPPCRADAEIGWPSPRPGQKKNRKPRRS